MERPVNEPVLGYAPGSTERAALTAELARQSQERYLAPLHLGGERVLTRHRRPVMAPHRHTLQLAECAVAEAPEVERAIAAARSAHPDWAALSQQARSAVFLRAAELLAGPWRQRLNAATILNQSKTAHQAEIDAACELIDFFRFNAYYAELIAREQPSDAPGVRNQLELRPLEGFVYAVTPFNFTAIAGNLPTAPALMGNTVLWKPSPLAALSAQHVMELLHEAGLPPGVINCVDGDAELVSRVALDQPDFAGLHFTGSTAVFQRLWQAAAERLPRYRAYPRLVGETGGKDFLFVHPSAELQAVVVAAVRGAFEYQGQKCSAASRLYAPRSLWPELAERLVAVVEQLTLGDPADYSNFMGAVISRGAYERLRRAQRLARVEAELLVGGGGDDREGYFIEPTVVRVGSPDHALMTEELFGPLLSVWVYEDARLDEALSACESHPYALTGAVFARDRRHLEALSQRLRFAAGNLYLNDKPTGAVVGQQPFGGGRLSGTNDKAGSHWNLMRWVSPRVIKETFVPPLDHRYPFLGPGA